MLKKIAVAVVVALVVLLLFATTRPDNFRVERRIVVQAPAEKIQPLIADFHRWGDWSPWERLDPALQRTFGGPASGVGSTYAWKGNKDVGSGRMEIKDAQPAKVAIQLDIIEPYEGHNTAEFTLAPQGSGTEVAWVMFGPMPYVSKLMSVFVSMDSLIGKDFEKGLAQMKAVAEGR